MKIYYWWWRSNLLLEINKAWYLTQQMRGISISHEICRQIEAYGIEYCKTQLQGEHKFINHTMEIFVKPEIKLINKLLEMEEGNIVINFSRIGYK